MNVESCGSNELSFEEDSFCHVTRYLLSVYYVTSDNSSRVTNLRELNYYVSGIFQRNSTLSKSAFLI